MEINSKSFYRGGFKNGVKNGKGFIKFEDGANYDGNFENDLFSGYGVAIYADGGKYIGNWSENKQNGNGKLLDASGNIIFDGDWQDGNPKPVKPVKLSGYAKYATVFKDCYNGNQTLTVFEEKIAAKLQMCLVLNSDLTINGFNTVSINIEDIIYECEYYVEGSLYESDNSFRLSLTSIKSSDTLPYGMTWENSAIINGTIYSEKFQEYLLQGKINDEDFDVTNY